MLSKFVCIDMMKWPSKEHPKEGYPKHMYSVTSSQYLDTSLSSIDWFWLTHYSDVKYGNKHLSNLLLLGIGVNNKQNYGLVHITTYHNYVKCTNYSLRQFELEKNPWDCGTIPTKKLALMIMLKYGTVEILQTLVFEMERCIWDEEKKTFVIEHTRWSVIRKTNIPTLKE